MEKTLYNLHGIISTVITPFKEDGSVDYDSLAKEIELGVKDGTNGFLVPCVASEYKYLTFEEKKQMTRVVVEAANKRVVVIGGVAAHTQEQRDALCEEFLGLGCDGLNLCLPEVSEEEYTKAVKRIDAMHPPFLMLQDEDDIGYGMREEFIMELYRTIPSFRCIKIEITGGNGPKYTHLAEASHGTINISCGWGIDQMIETMDRGVHALMPSGLFKLYSNVYRLYHEKNREAAKKLFFDMLPIVTFTRQFGYLNRTFHKMYLKRAGAFKTTLLRQEGIFDSYSERYANEMLDRAAQLEANIDSYWK